MPEFDLVIIGSGSGNALITPEWDGKRVALVEASTFGGTCLNAGCIPTKMLVYAAEAASAVRHAHIYGVDAHVDQVRWPDIRDRVFGRTDLISHQGKAFRADSANVSLLTGVASFEGVRSLAVETVEGKIEHLTAAQVVIAAGSRPIIPDVINGSGVDFHTSDTVMRIAELPTSMLILGGGYVAAQFAHVFSNLGVDVTIVSRGKALLTSQDEQISARFTALANTKWNVRYNANVVTAQQATDESASALKAATSSRPPCYLSQRADDQTQTA